MKNLAKTTLASVFPSVKLGCSQGPQYFNERAHAGYSHSSRNTVDMHYVNPGYYCKVKGLQSWLASSGQVGVVRLEVELGKALISSGGT
jgi:hypothetical protein